MEIGRKAEAEPLRKDEAHHKGFEVPVWTQKLGYHAQRVRFKNTSQLLDKAFLYTMIFQGHKVVSYDGVTPI